MTRVILLVILIGMKTAISIEDKVFNDAEVAAKILGISRSLLYTQAVKEYITHHLPQNITDNYNKVYSSIKDEEVFINDLALETLSKVEWDD